MMDGVATINWRMNRGDRYSNYQAIAEGYFIAANRTIDSLLQDNVGNDADAAIFPVLFCGYHAIELYLKAIIGALRARCANQWDIKIEGGHRLDDLIDQLNKELSPCERFCESNPVEETKEFFELLSFYKSIGSDLDGSFHVDFARYPESASRSGSQLYSFVVEKSAININLSVLESYHQSVEDLLLGLYARAADSPLDEN